MGRIRRCEEEWKAIVAKSTPLWRARKPIALLIPKPTCNPPTDALPGTEAKVVSMCYRRLRGLSLFHPQDAKVPDYSPIWEESYVPGHDPFMGLGALNYEYRLYTTNMNRVLFENSILGTGNT